MTTESTSPMDVAGVSNLPLLATMVSRQDGAAETLDPALSPDAQLLLPLGPTGAPVMVTSGRTVPMFTDLEALEAWQAPPVGLAPDPDFGVEVASVRIVAMAACNDLIASCDAGQISLNPAGPVMARIVAGPAPPAGESPPPAGRRGLRERLHVDRRPDPTRDQRIGPGNRERLRAWVARPLADGLAAAEAGEPVEAVRSVMLAQGRAMYFGDRVTMAVAELHAARILADQRKWDQGLNVLLMTVMTHANPASPLIQYEALMTMWTYTRHVGGDVMGPKIPGQFAGFLRTLADVAVTYGSMSASRRELIYGQAEEIGVTWRP